MNGVNLGYPTVKVKENFFLENIKSRKYTLTCHQLTTAAALVESFAHFIYNRSCAPEIQPGSRQSTIAIDVFFIETGHVRLPRLFDCNAFDRRNPIPL